jgi:hypothetical protein
MCSGKGNLGKIFGSSECFKFCDTPQLAAGSFIPTEIASLLSTLSDIPVNLEYSFKESRCFG